ncbi:MAG: hypothetical protein ACK4SY_02145 [Pyrobaculum sp.]
MERGKALEYATILGAAAILGYLAYITAVGLYQTTGGQPPAGLSAPGNTRLSRYMQLDIVGYLNIQTAQLR